MKIYFAGFTAQKKVSEFVPTVLESYLTYRGNPQRLIEDVKEFKIKDFFLDSGAFTAFSKGTQINIDEYIEFCHAVKDYVKVISNLDVIGNPEETYKNWLYMRSKGVNALPVIHYGADPKFFDIYFKEHKEPYVAFGGLVPYARQKDKLKVWLDYCYYKLKDYFPVKTHLFGIVSPWALRRYPLYSCDGTSWLQGGQYGTLTEYHKLGIRAKAHGDFYKSERDYKYRDIENAKAYMLLNDKITKLWEMKGIVWPD